MNLTETIRDSKLIDVFRRLGIERKLHDLYWTVFPFFIDEHYRATVGEAKTKFHLSTPAERHNLRESDFLGEREIIRHLLARVRPTDVFYDVGAQFGAYSCLVSDLLVGGTVVAFDPDTRRVSRIRNNFELNGVDGVVLPVALSDRQGSKNFKLSTGELTGNAGTEVETTTVDYLVKEEIVPEPTIMKVDVEGAELDVFRGMTETMDRSLPRVIYCETHETVDSNVVREFLRDYDYTVSGLDSHSTFLYAKFDGSVESDSDLEQEDA